MTAEIAKIEVTPISKGGRLVFVFFGLVTIFVYLFGLSFPFIGPDEPRYAQVAQEMLDRGDWITPTLGGFPWFEKPPLLYWLEMIAYKLFGVSELAARLGPALCGLGTVACLWWLGRNFVPGKEKKDLDNWLAFIAASTLSVIAFAHDQIGRRCQRFCVDARSRFPPLQAGCR